MKRLEKLDKLCPIMAKHFNLVNQLISVKLAFNDQSMRVQNKKNNNYTVAYFMLPHLCNIQYFL
jgi:hypothetical protein